MEIKKKDPSHMWETIMGHEEAFRTLFESTPYSITISDVEGRLVDVNPRFCERSGLSREDCIGLRPGELPEMFRLNEEDEAALIQKLNEQGFLSDEEIKVNRMSDGESRTLILTANRLRLAGKPRILSIVKDITKQKRAEEILQAQYNLVQALGAARNLDEVLSLCVRFAMEGSGMDCGAMYLLNEDGSLSLYCHSGLSDAIVQKLSRCAPDSPRTLLALKGEPIFCLHSQLGVDEGGGSSEEGLLAMGVIPIKHEQRVIGCLAIGSRTQTAVSKVVQQFLITITSLMGEHIIRKQTEEALRESEEKHRLFFEHSPLGIVHFSGKGVVTSVNEAAVNIFGSSRERLIGQDFNELPDKKFAREFFRALKGERGEYEGLYTSYTGGKEVWLKANWFPVVAAGRVQAGFGVFEDISEAKRSEAERDRLEEQCRQAQKVDAMGKLAGGVAHDLNNLLTPILGYGEMVMGEFGSNDRRKRYVSQIVQAGNRARDLVHQLLAFGRKQPLVYRALNLNDTIKGVEKLLRVTVREDIHFEIVPGAGLSPVMADVGQVEQVLMNLSVNAQDSMPDGGRLTIKTDMVEMDEGCAAACPDLGRGSYVMLTVSDTGCGMDRETREHIFEPFFSTKGENGTGLGLATVYGIVKQHGGGICVQSKPGRGTTFKVCLPVSEEGPYNNKVSEKPSGPLDGSETILLAEDNEEVRELAHAILTRQGYKVLAAESGSRALEMLGAHEGPVDLLLTDVMMPGMNGCSLFEKAAEHHPGLRALYMSGYTDNIIANHGALSDEEAFIQKPFTAVGLAAKVREVLDQSGEEGGRFS